MHFDFAFDPSDTSTLWISVGPNLVVTARERPLRSVDKLRRLLVRLGRLLAPEPSTFFRLLHHHLPWVAAVDLHELRQSSEEFSAPS